MRNGLSQSPRAVSPGASLRRRVGMELGGEGQTKQGDRARGPERPGFFIFKSRLGSVADSWLDGGNRGLGAGAVGS
jgi:hypothetical protein